MERELVSLIQDVLDGVAAPEEVARLEARMRQDPAVRARRDELAQVFGALRNSRRFEAPPELRSSILRALPPSAPGVRTVVPIEVRRRFRLAYVFAAGLTAGVIGAGALSGFWKAPAPGTTVLGTMAPSSAAVASAHWQAGPARVDGRSWRSGTTRLASFHVEGGQAEIELTFDPATLSCTAFHSAPQGSGATLEPGRVVFRTVEPSEALVELHELPGGRGGPLRVTIRAGGGATAGELPAPPVPEAGR